MNPLASEGNSIPDAGTNPAHLDAPLWLKRRSQPAHGAIIITDDFLGLSIARSLGRHGIPVYIMTEKPLIASFSRYCTRRLSWNFDDETKQLDYLLDVSKRYGLEGWAVFATQDRVMTFLARHHSLLMEQYQLGVPPWNLLRWVLDKRLMNQLCTEIGIPHPTTVYPTSRDEVMALGGSLPLLIKPALHERATRLATEKAWIVNSPADLLDRYEQACTFVSPGDIMIQEFIPGMEETQTSFSCLCVDGEPVAYLTSRRIRQYPVDFGITTYVETVDRPEVERSARRLLSAIHYTGLCSLGFKRDPRNGEYKLLDFNARPWATNALARPAGIDFPYLYWRVIRGDHVQTRRAPNGLRWINMRRDLQAVATEIRRGNLTVGDYARSMMGRKTGAAFAMDDPLPAILDLPVLLYRWLKAFRHA